MKKLEKFLDLMTGHFDNKEQFSEMIAEGKPYPYAEHVNTVCDDLFLITETEDGVMLSSYEIPAGANKNIFSYVSMGVLDYRELKKSEKFTPAIYREKDGVWEGGSISQFSPVMTFKLWERFSEQCLEVSESMEVNGKRTFGYDEPIIYKRV